MQIGQAGHHHPRLNGVIDLRGETNLRELVRLVYHSQGVLSSITCVMHLAAAVGTPIIAIWGSSDSRRWRPWNVEHRVVQNPFECNPCPGYRCLVADSPLCIESVTVEQVDRTVDELLSNESRQS